LQPQPNWRCHHVLLAAPPSQASTPTGPECWIATVYLQTNAAPSGGSHTCFILTKPPKGGLITRRTIEASKDLPKCRQILLFESSHNFTVHGIWIAVSICKMPPANSGPFVFIKGRIMTKEYESFFRVRCTSLATQRPLGSCSASTSARAGARAGGWSDMTSSASPLRRCQSGY